MEEVAKCGCPIPDDAGGLGWHLKENHPEVCTNPSGWFVRGKLQWSARQPTVKECELVSRDESYTNPWDDPGGWGDYVIEVEGDHQAKSVLALACELLGVCDAAHVIPAGVYLEE